MNVAVEDVLIEDIPNADNAAQTYSSDKRKENATPSGDSTQSKKKHKVQDDSFADDITSLTEDQVVDAALILVNDEWKLRLFYKLKSDEAKTRLLQVVLCFSEMVFTVLAMKMESLSGQRALTGPAGLLRRLSPVRVSLRCGGSSASIDFRARPCSLLCNCGLQGLLNGAGAFHSSSSPPANRIIALPHPNFLTDEDSRAFRNHNSAPATDFALECSDVLLVLNVLDS
ncbi:hypothetical protein LINPERHAP2_LOCUS20880 [Linum perenne]